VMEWHPLGHVEDMYTEDDQFSNPVRLIRFDAEEGSSELHGGGDDILLSIRSVYTAFDNNPLGMLQTAMESLPNYVDVIVGHSLVSSTAALRLRDQLYPNSKVIASRSQRVSLIVIPFCLFVCRSFRDLQPTTIDRSQPNLVGRYIPVFGPV